MDNRKARKTELGKTELPRDNENYIIDNIFTMKSF